jgi:hypothetical protein
MVAYFRYGQEIEGFSRLADELPLANHAIPSLLGLTARLLLSIDPGNQT